MSEFGEAFRRQHPGRAHLQFAVYEPGTWRAFSAAIAQFIGASYTRNTATMLRLIRVVCIAFLCVHLRSMHSFLFSVGAGGRTNEHVKVRMKAAAKTIIPAGINRDAIKTQKKRTAAFVCYFRHCYFTAIFKENKLFFYWGSGGRVI